MFSCIYSTGGNEYRQGAGKKMWRKYKHEKNNLPANFVYKKEPHHVTDAALVNCVGGLPMSSSLVKLILIKSTSPMPTGAWVRILVPAAIVSIPATAVMAVVWVLVTPTI